MSALDQSRHFHRRAATSGLPPLADILLGVAIPYRYVRLLYNKAHAGLLRLGSLVFLLSLLQMWVALDQGTEIGVERLDVF